MANEVSSTEEVKLQDGAVVVLRPLNIKNMRKFMKLWHDFGNEPDFGEDVSEEEQIELAQDREYDMFISLSGVCLEKELKKKVTEGAENNDEEEQLYKDYLEDVLDMPTIFKVIEVCAGMKLNDPNLLAAAAKALAGQEMAGTTSTL